MLFARFIRHLSHLLLPQHCIFCHIDTREAYPICRPCQQELPILPHHCLKCAQNLSPGNEIELVCGSCLQSPPPFHRIYTLFPYKPPITQLIINLKFRHQLGNARALGLLMAEKALYHWYSHSSLPDLLIPTPLHPLRLKERGFNQSLEIAKAVAHALHLPIDRFGIKRIRLTASQSSLPAKQRLNNVKGAFSTTINYKGLHVAIIDDVVTTGHTISEISQVLKQAGAARIDVWCCARA